MAKFPEAQARLFKNKFVCKNCKSTLRADNTIILAGKIKCRKCHSRKLRPVRKK